MDQMEAAGIVGASQGRQAPLGARRPHFTRTNTRQQMKRFITLLLPCCSARSPAPRLPPRATYSTVAPPKSRVPQASMSPTPSRPTGIRPTASFVIQGDMFTISSPGLRSWYDGKTQWTYSSQIGEVNIITPTPEEVSQINPWPSSRHSPPHIPLSLSKLPPARLLSGSRPKTPRLTSLRPTSPSTTRPSIPPASPSP